MPRKVKRSSTKKRNATKPKAPKMRGGAGYTLTDCKIGGMSEVRAYSECPQNSGPLSPRHAQDLYSAPILFSGGGGTPKRRKSVTAKRGKAYGQGCGY